jgi:hypothetical protein
MSTTPELDQATLIVHGLLTDAIEHNKHKPDRWRATDLETANQVTDVLVAVAADLIFNGRRRGLAAAKRYIAGLTETGN